jgi:hypothetical protein
MKRSTDGTVDLSAMAKTRQRLARASLGMAKREITSGAAAQTFELSIVMANRMTEGQEGSKAIAPIRLVVEG